MRKSTTNLAQNSRQAVWPVGSTTCIVLWAPRHQCGWHWLFGNKGSVSGRKRDLSPRWTRPWHPPTVWCKGHCRADLKSSPPNHSLNSPHIHSRMMGELVFQILLPKNSTWGHLRQGKQKWRTESTNLIAWSPSIRKVGVTLIEAWKRTNDIFHCMAGWTIFRGELDDPLHPECLAWHTCVLSTKGNESDEIKRTKKQFKGSKIRAVLDIPAGVPSHKFMALYFLFTKL